ncbi:hypothetical protein CFP65_7290 [Kitasatospora sp. MMS16-BH015]|uniref:PxKF domain-containing protein n=1 Tax=Kitasatospora sp. MMS16-BH015 TaxID=2018025 RepID=UPI000CA168A0|nr:PxKF domain-containing protein [Kitasatospora sp. MMS16-BH015]AUG81876.1 hypothetical protein CFP65_7290 [Kitasatospora sp. MMS16-BH015]
MFGGAPATGVTVVNDFTVTATAPASTAVGAVDVTVTTPGGTSTASAADQYTYAYAFFGFDAPVGNSPTVNKAHAGRSIPMKFSLGGNHGLNMLGPGQPTAQQIDCTTGTATGQPVPPSSSSADPAPPAPPPRGKPSHTAPPRPARSAVGGGQGDAVECGTC